jgi:hypothetical protein
MNVPSDWNFSTRVVAEVRGPKRVKFTARPLRDVDEVVVVDENAVSAPATHPSCCRAFFPREPGSPDLTPQQRRFVERNRRRARNGARPGRGCLIALMGAQILPGHHAPLGRAR